MNFLKNNYYVNWVYSFFRGTSKLEEYLSSPYNDAIIQLVKEGYDFTDELERIINAYSSLNALSYEESKYVKKISNKSFEFSLNVMKLMLSPDYIELCIKVVKYGLSCLKLTWDNNDFQFYLKFLIVKNSNLEVNLSKIFPINGFVTQRRFIKAIQEKIILKNINSIKIVNYLPSKKIISKV